MDEQYPHISRRRCVPTVRLCCVSLLAVTLSSGPLCAVDAADTGPPEDPPGQQQPNESIAGRTLDEWRQVMKSLELNAPAAQQAVPGLIELCRDERVPQPTRAQAAYLLGRIRPQPESAIGPLTTLLTARHTSDGSETVRWAAKALAMFGTLAAPATPQLIDVAHDEQRPLDARLTAVEALGAIGGAHPDAIPALMRLAEARHVPVTFESTELRGAAIDSLLVVGPAAAAAVPLLIRITRDESADLRMRAATAMGGIGGAAEIAAESLVDLVLFDDEWIVRDAATTALTRIGDSGQAALVQLLQDEDVTVRRRAAEAFAGAIRLSDESRSALSQALSDEDSEVRLSAVAALQATDADPAPLLEVLLASLTDPERLPRIRAYRLLLKMPDAARSVAPQLRQLADDPRPHVRQVARKALEDLAATKSAAGR
jgi:HEAT repeat protein